MACITHAACPCVMSHQGSPIDDYNLEKREVRALIASGDLWTRLSASCTSAHLMGCASICKSGTEKSAQEMHGIRQNQTYRIVEMRAMTRRKMVRVKNTAGEEEWDGEYGRESKGERDACMSCACACACGRVARR